LAAGGQEKVRVLRRVGGTEGLEASDGSVLSESLLHGPFAYHSGLATGGKGNNLLAGTWNHGELITTTVVGGIVINVGNEVSGPGVGAGGLGLGEDERDLGTDDTVMVVDGAHESDVGGNWGRAADKDIGKAISMDKDPGRSMLSGERKLHIEDRHMLHS